MKRCPNSRILAIVATLCLSLMAVSAFAQLQTGNIFGKTQAKDGSVLPGVTVTLTGIGAPQTTVTDAQGNFRFLNLSPGSYTVKAELAGFGTATRAGLTVQRRPERRHHDDAQRRRWRSRSRSRRKRRSSTSAKRARARTCRRSSWRRSPPRAIRGSILQSVPAVQVDRINVGGNAERPAVGLLRQGRADRATTRGTSTA